MNDDAMTSYWKLGVAARQGTKRYPQLALALALALAAAYILLIGCLEDGGFNCIFYCVLVWLLVYSFCRPSMSLLYR
jgi:hypothetical protein